MMKGDITLSLKNQREILSLLDRMAAYHSEGVEDGYGATEAERKKSSFSHAEFDIEHETAEPDPMQAYCPQCFSLNANRRIKAILQED